MKCNANSDLLRGYRIKLYPTDSQKIELNRNIDASRTIYNIGLSIIKDNYEKGLGYTKFFDMCAIFANMRNSDKYH